LGHGKLTQEKMDAEYLPEAIPNGSVDVLWDRKGWLFILGVMGDLERLFETLEKYRRKLRVGGVIVIDNMPKTMVPDHQTEPSTVFALSVHHEEVVWKKINSMFDVQDIGEGVTALRILRRKDEGVRSRSYSHRK
jgi:hypothetical protein